MTAFTTPNTPIYLKYKAILLVRVSSLAQSIDEQTKQLLNYALSKGYSENNLIIIEDKESAIKLSEEERNGLNQMKEYIVNDSSINAVFVWELSRLFRRQKTGFSLREYFITNKIQLYCYSPNFQLLTDDCLQVDGSGSIVFALFSEMADAEMRNKKERFKRSKIKNARLGKYSGGFKKYGYDIDENGYYQVNPEQAEIIKMIFNRYEGGISMKKLTVELNERGIINTYNFVSGILNSKQYTGLSNKFGYNRIYPIIISAEQFNKCKEIAKGNNVKSDKAKEIYYVKNLIKCTCCGLHYIAQKSQNMYMCSGRFGAKAILHPETVCKESAPININLIDSLAWYVVKEIEMYLTGSETVETIEKLKNDMVVNNEIIENYQKQIQATEKKLDRNNEMYLNGNIGIDKYNLNQNKVKEEIMNFKNSIVDLKNNNEKNQALINIYVSENDLSIYGTKENYLNSLNDKQKQELIKKHIHSINVFEEVFHASKIVVINYDLKNYEQFRIRTGKSPIIQYDANKSILFNKNESIKDKDWINKVEKSDWVRIDVPILRRFERKQK